MTSEKPLASAADDYGALECSVSENVIGVGVGINDVPNRLRRHLLAESFDIYSRSTPPSNFEIGSHHLHGRREPASTGARIRTDQYP